MSEVPQGKDQLIRSVANRLNLATSTGDAATVHEPAAQREAEELLGYLATAAGADPHVEYVLGLLYLLRATTTSGAGPEPGGTAGQEGTLALILLAPLYFNLPGSPDLLPAPVRAMLDQVPGFPGRPADTAELVQVHAESLGNLGMLLLGRAVAPGQAVSGRAAAAVLRAASARLAPDRPSRAMILCNLGYALLLRDPQPEQLTEAVTVLREAFARTPAGDPNYARCANGLGLALLGASGLSRDRAMLAEAAGMLRIATRSARGTESNLPQMLSDLGFTLVAYVQSAETGETAGPAVAQEAIQVLRRSADLIPPGDPRRPQVLLRLAEALLTAERPEEATDLLVRSDAGFPPGSEHSQAAGRLLFRAAMLKAQLKRDRDPEQRAVRELLDEILGPVVETLQGNRAGADENPLTAVLSLLGIGKRTDQSRNADLMRLAAEVLTTPDDVSAMPGLIAKAVDTVSRRFGDLPAEERGEALAQYLESVRQRKDDRQAAAAYPSPVDVSGLDELQELHDRLLPELEPGSREEALVRNGRRLLSIRKLTFTPASEDAGSQLRRMRQLAPLIRELMETFPQDLERTGVAPGLFGARVAFAHAQASPFETLALMEEWVRELRHRVAALSADAPERTEARTALAVALFLHASVSSDETSFREGRDVARDLAASAWPLSAALLSAWTQCESLRLQRASLAPPVPDAAGQSLNPLTRLASDRAATALAERDATGALEALEEGRSQLLSSALNTRSELEALRGEDADLHSRLLTVLDAIGNLRRTGLFAGRLATPEEGEQFLELANEGTRLVSELKKRPGYNRFLTPLPLGLADLRPAAADGPVVTINVNPRRCDALALCPDGLRTVPLPRLTARDLTDQAESFRTAAGILVTGQDSPVTASARAVFDGVLRWLWDVLAEPVLDALGFSAPPEHGAPWPRVWWSPTGVLNSFPLHAAGHHDRPGASVLDRVASSYTPTLRALLLSRARAGRGPGERRVLAVAMPGTAGHAPLTQTVAEATAAARDGGLQLTGTDATRAAVLSALPGTAVAHFACHASSDPGELTASYLLLHDGTLQLRDIAGLRLDGAELAYLSACGTTRGSTALADEAIHLASAFQLAGYSQSVATLWEVSDTFAATAAAGFYRTLTPALTAPAPLPAALALHSTIRELRDSRRDEPWTWAALLHAGA